MFYIDRYNVTPLDRANDDELRLAMAQMNPERKHEYLGFDSFRGDDGLEGESRWDVDGLGSDVFGFSLKKAFKKATGAVGSVGKAAQGAVRTVTKPVSNVVSKVPVVGNVASKAVTAAGNLAVPATLLSPKGVVSDTLAVAKAAIPMIPLAQELAKSPVVRMTALGLAVVFPPVGVPATTALATIAAVTKGLESSVPGVKEFATKVVKATAALAQSGDKDARTAMTQMVAQKGAQKATQLTSPPSGAKRFVFDLYPTGKIAQVTV